MIIDIFSRYVLGWMLAHREAAALAERLLADTVATQHVEPGQLTIHADRGSSMTSKPVALLLADLGVTKSHPGRMSQRQPLQREPVQDPQAPPELPRPVRLARGRPSVLPGGSSAGTTSSTATPGSRFHTPADVHYGQAEQVITARAAVLDAAYAAHPERFVRKPPRRRLPTAVWINKPINPSEPPQQFPG